MESDWNPYFHCCDAGDLMNQEHKLDELCNEIARLGYADDLAAELTEALLTIRQTRVRIDAIIRRTSDAVYVYFRWGAGKLTEDQFKAAFKAGLDKYRSGKKEV